MRYISRFYIICLSTILIGCVGPVLNLAGDSSSGTSHNAILKGVFSESGSFPFITSFRTIFYRIDQTEIRVTGLPGIDISSQPSEIHLNPGHHSVSIGFWRGRGSALLRSRGGQVVEFDAEAGHRYEARVTIFEEGGDFRWDAEIVDLDTGKKFMHR